MFRLALKMLYGDVAKFIMLVGGLTVCALLMTQQSGVFCGLMRWTTATIRNIDVPIWVCDARVEQVNEIVALRDVEVNRVRSVEGVDWAVPLYWGIIQTRLPNGSFQAVQLTGLDAATLVGRPSRMIEGRAEDLRLPNAVIVDQVARKKFKQKGLELNLGDVFEINDKEARVVGICQLEQSFMGQPYIYTTYDRALEYVPQQRKQLAFILAKPRDGATSAEVAQRIRKSTGLGAYTSDEFSGQTMAWYIKYTGIPVSFGTVVLLGVIVGIAIAGQTFYLFVHENIRHLAALKAMGASNTLLAEMVFLQAFVVGGTGYGLGTGLTALLGGLFLQKGEPPFYLPWEVLVFAGGVIIFICLFAAVIGLIKVFRAEPAVVFR